MEHANPKSALNPLGLLRFWEGKAYAWLTAIGEFNTSGLDRGTDGLSRLRPATYLTIL